MAHIVSRTGIGKVPPSAPLFLDVAGNVNFDAASRTGGISTLIGYATIQVVTNGVSLETRITGEANPLFALRRDGEMSWGIGSASPTDTFLYRSGVGLLRTPGSFTVDTNLLVSADGTITGNFSVNGNTTLGNAATDSISFIGRANTDLAPIANNLYDLGLSGLGWKNLYVSGSQFLGTGLSDVLIVNSSVGSSLLPLTDNTFNLGTTLFRWASIYSGTLLQSDGNTILGDSASDALTVNARISSDLNPTTTGAYALGLISHRWSHLFLSTLLDLSGSAILGTTVTDSVVFNSRINSNFEPSLDATFNLGAVANRWLNAYVANIDASGDLTVNGNTILGDASSDTLTVNARINSNLIPAADDTYDIGTPALRWQTLHVGPGSIVVHNDATDTAKIILGYTGSVASLISDASSPINIAVLGTNGIYADIAGLIGINNLVPTRQLDVTGTGAFSDTLYAARSTGLSLVVESDMTVKGNLEAPASTKALNIGVTSDTEFVNIGTGPSLQTINIGTSIGPTIINIGSAGDFVNINGTTFFSSTINTSVYDKTFTLNAGGSAGSSPNSGLYVEEAAVATLAATDAIWQAATTVRYAMVATGNIVVGSTVTIAGFANAPNNGTFNVINVSANVFIEVTSTRINAAQDETTAATVTNPTNVASFFVNSLANGWDFISPAAVSNMFSFRNTGGDTILTSTAAGLIISAPGNAILPTFSGDDLGSAALRWDIFAANADVSFLTVSGNLTVNGNTILGDASSDTVVLNGVTSFVNGISSNLIPTSAFQNIGSAADRWQELYLFGSADIDGSIDVASNATIGVDLVVLGNTTLGDAASDLISFIASVDTNIIPSVDLAFSLGSASFRWDRLYTNSISLYSLGNSGTGGVLFGNNFSISDNTSQFFWDNSNFRLGLGTNAPTTQFELLRNSSAPSIKVSRSDTSHGIGFLADSTSRFQYTNNLLFSAVNVSNLGTANAGTNALNIASTGLVSLLGGLSLNYGAAIAANTYAVAANDTIIPVDTASVSITANCAITLPSAATQRMLVIKDIGNSCSNVNKNIILTPSAGQFIEFGIADETYIIDNDGMSLTLHSDGVSRWYII